MFAFPFPYCFNRESRLLGFAQSETGHDSNEAKTTQPQSAEQAAETEEQKIQRLTEGAKAQIANYREKLPPKFQEEFDERLHAFVRENIGTMGEEKLRGELMSIIEKFTQGMDKGKVDAEGAKKEQERKLKSLKEEAQELRLFLDGKTEEMPRASIEALENLTPEELSRMLTLYNEKYAALVRGNEQMKSLVQASVDVKEAFDLETKPEDLNAAGAGSAIATGALIGTAIGGWAFGLGTVIGAAGGVLTYMGGRLVYHLAHSAENERRATEVNSVFNSARGKFTKQKKQVDAMGTDMENAKNILVVTPEDLRKQAAERYRNQSESLGAAAEQVESGKVQAAETQQSLLRNQAAIQENGQEMLNEQEESVGLALAEIAVASGKLNEASADLLGRSQEEADLFQGATLESNDLQGKITRSLFEGGLHTHILREGIDQSESVMQGLTAEAPNVVENTWVATFEGFGQACKKVFKEGIADNLSRLTKGTAFEHAAGVVAGISEGVGELGEGIGTMLAHPVDTAKGLGALVGLHSEVSAGQAWKEMGKALIAYNEFEEGNYGKGTGKVLFNILTTATGAGAAAKGVQTMRWTYRTARTTGGAGILKATTEAAASGITEVGTSLRHAPNEILSGAGRALKAPAMLKNWLSLDDATRLSKTISTSEKELLSLTSSMEELAKRSQFGEKLTSLMPDELRALTPADLSAYGIQSRRDIRRFLRYRELSSKYASARSALQASKEALALENVEPGLSRIKDPAEFSGRLDLVGGEARLEAADALLGRELSLAEQQALIRAHRSRSSIADISAEKLQNGVAARGALEKGKELLRTFREEHAKRLMAEGMPEELALTRAKKLARRDVQKLMDQGVAGKTDSTSVLDDLDDATKPSNGPETVVNTGADTDEFNIVTPKMQTEALLRRYGLSLEKGKEVSLRSTKREARKHVFDGATEEGKLRFLRQEVDGTGKVQKYALDVNPLKVKNLQWLPDGVSIGQKIPLPSSIDTVRILRKSTVPDSNKVIVELGGKQFSCDIDALSDLVKGDPQGKWTELSGKRTVNRPLVKNRIGHLKLLDEGEKLKSFTTDELVRRAMDRYKEVYEHPRIIADPEELRTVLKNIRERARVYDSNFKPKDFGLTDEAIETKVSIANYESQILRRVGKWTKESTFALGRGVRARASKLGEIDAGQFLENLNPFPHWRTRRISRQLGHVQSELSDANAMRILYEQRIADLKFRDLGTIDAVSGKSRKELLRIGCLERGARKADFKQLKIFARGRDRLVRRADKLRKQEAVLMRKNAPEKLRETDALITEKKSALKVLRKNLRANPAFPSMNKGKPITGKFLDDEIAKLEAIEWMKPNANTVEYKVMLQEAKKLEIELMELQAQKKNIAPISKTSKAVEAAKDGLRAYVYEAMDNTGMEIKRTIRAASEAEAQQMIREQGYFVTKIGETR